MHGQAIDHSGGQPLLEVSQIRPHILHSNLVTEMSHYRTFVHILRVVLISQTSYCCVIQLVGNNYEFRIRVTQLKSGIHVGVSDAQTTTVRLKPKNTARERIMESISMRTNLKVSSSFDLIITASI